MSETKTEKKSDTDTMVRAKELAKHPIAKLLGSTGVLGAIVLGVLNFTNARLDAEAALMKELGEVKSEVVALRKEVKESAEIAAKASRVAHAAELELAKREKTVDDTAEAVKALAGVPTILDAMQKQLERMERRLGNKE